MDAKANTLFCASPLIPSRPESGAPGRNPAYLIVVRGGVPGSMLRVGTEDTSLGRSSDNTFPLDDMSVSRRHATVRIDDRGRISIADEGSTNGTFVNGTRLEPRRAVDLHDGDRIQLGTGVVFKLARLDASDEHFQLELFERTVRDGLTGAYNRTYFLNRVAGLVSRYAAQGIGLAVLMVDIDRFKRINDRHGHLVGDTVLREVSTVLRESTRNEDLVARYGGEEFVVALPMSSPEHAVERAGRIRVSVASRRIRACGADIRVTVSIGVAFSAPQHPVTDIALLKAADDALYRAKATGRNRVVLDGDTKPSSVETLSADMLTAS